MVWTPEPAYEKRGVSVRATTLYYEIVAPLMLPFVERRILNLFRCVEGKCFFQRSKAHPPSGRRFQPPIRFESIAQKNGRTEEYLYITDAAGLVACAKADAVEFHGWGSRAGLVEKPDRMVIDLDPDPELGFGAVKSAALQLRRSFEVVGLESFALLSGGKGIHVVVPLRPEADWEQVRDFSKQFATALANADPERFTVALPKEKRRGRIFLDFLRNHRTATAILPYSARARSGTPVAAPVSWTELERIERPDSFTILDAERLLGRAGELARWGQADQALPLFG
jgi:bifunctional non-homologous end joining protein LigD